jgi:hypothetical protein
MAKSTPWVVPVAAEQEAELCLLLGHGRGRMGRFSAHLGEARATIHSKRLFVLMNVCSESDNWNP